jgi:hypothetical protein
MEKGAPMVEIMHSNISELAQLRDEALLGGVLRNYQNL